MDGVGAEFVVVFVDGEEGSVGVVGVDEDAFDEFAFGFTCPAARLVLGSVVGSAVAWQVRLKLSMDVRNHAAFDFGFVVWGVGSGFDEEDVVVVEELDDSVGAFDFAEVHDEFLWGVWGSCEFAAECLEDGCACEVCVEVESFAGGGFVGSVGGAEGEDGAGGFIDDGDAFWACVFACDGVYDEDVGSESVDEPDFAGECVVGVDAVEVAFAFFAGEGLGEGFEVAVDGVVAGQVFCAEFLAEDEVFASVGEVLGGWVGFEACEEFFDFWGEGCGSAAFFRVFGLVALDGLASFVFGDSEEGGELGGGDFAVDGGLGEELGGGLGVGLFGEAVDVRMRHTYFSRQLAQPFTLLFCQRHDFGSQVGQLSPQLADDRFHTQTSVMVLRFEFKHPVAHGVGGDSDSCEVVDHEGEFGVGDSLFSRSLELFYQVRAFPNRLAQFMPSDSQCSHLRLLIEILNIISCSLTKSQ